MLVTPSSSSRPRRSEECRPPTLRAPRVLIDWSIDRSDEFDLRVYALVTSCAPLNVLLFEEVAHGIIEEKTEGSGVEWSGAEWSGVEWSIIDRVVSTGSRH